MKIMRRNSQAGVTLIELVIVVAIIGILATVAVFMFTKTSAKAKIQSEITAMFAEFKQRLSQAQFENGAYPVLACEPDCETTIHPSTVATMSKANALYPLHASWTALRMAPSASSTYCSYALVTGVASTSTNLGAVIQTMGVASADVPGTDWYYVLAKCDADSDGTDYSYYAISSWADGFVKKDVGQ